MPEKKIYILSGARTPIASFRGSFANFGAVELGALAAKAAISRSGVAPEKIEEVIGGCVLSAGLGQNVTRQVALAAGLPVATQAVTINKVCSSSMKALVLAAVEIKAGYYDTILVVGTENMSQVPFYLPRGEIPFGGIKTTDGIAKDGLEDIKEKQPMGLCAEKTAKDYGITREEQDAYAIESYKKASVAWSTGRFAEEVVPVTVKTARSEVVVAEDEEYKKLIESKVSSLKPVFVRDGSGTITPANASSLNDGAVAAVVVGENSIPQGVQPLAELVAFAEAGRDPIDFTVAPVDAVRKLLQKSGLKVSDIALWELNEAFAVTALAFIKELQIDPTVLNVKGGAVAIGHPLGMSGLRIVNSLAYSLNAGQFGVAAICNGGAIFVQAEESLMTEDNGTVELPKGKVVGCTWQVVRKLGEGGCGSVYLVRNLEDDTEAAMKAESNNATGGCVLKLEVAILKRLSGRPHVAQFLFAARLTDFSYVIMTVLGESLQKIVKRMGRQITVSSQVRIAANVLFCLKQIHDIGFIHRDLKPANMALGYKMNTDECRFFHILDFGLARQFVVSQSDEPSKLMMRRPRERSLFRGTTRYCSIRMHDRAEQGRVDDLWSMIYLLAELRGPLPWASQGDKRVVGEMKRLHSDEVVLQNSPMEFLEIAKHLRCLTYFHRPDYHKIYMLLMSVMEKGKFTWSDPFDWEMPALNPTSKSTSASPVQLSREVVKKTQSRETDKLSKENPSKEDVRTAKTMSKEKLSRENLSKERTSKESVNGSAEIVNGSAERAEEEQKREKYMKILPFDPDFFALDPIGF
ncbi:unnamed protein product [Caenorhabditis sp. 36 PRJEB53466]|nr:unnamed protein product [Caenorhabditis sp. 36 PRJEB53466]